MNCVRPVLLSALLAAAWMLSAAETPAIPRLQITTVDEPGAALVIVGEVRDREGRLVRDVTLHVYQTDTTGRYTVDKPMDEPHARLAGFLTAPDGRFELRTIRPGGYPKAVRLGDRERHIPAHVHVDLKAPGHEERRLQVVFDDDPLLRDPYWADWVIKQRHPVVKLARDGAVWRGRLDVTLD
jgi:protocatechuate 3,4-dioxygenase beta subunit